MKIQECMISKNGKLQFAIKLNAKGNDSGRSYITMHGGEICFCDSYFTTESYDIGNESHRIAREIFMEQVKTDIKTRILELKQLESVFRELGIEDLFAYDEIKPLIGTKHKPLPIPMQIPNQTKQNADDNEEDDLEMVPMKNNNLQRSMNNAKSHNYRGTPMR